MGMENINKQYDLTSIQEFFNEIETPCQLVEELTQLIFNYAQTIDADSVGFFKKDLSAILFFRDALKNVN